MQNAQYIEDNSDENFLEFIKHVPDYEDSEGNKRKYSYNDGIVYITDTYWDRLDAKYKKDLETLKKVADKGTRLSVPEPSKAYTQPKHLQFKVSTVVGKDNDSGKEPGTECCDVRLTTVTFDKDKTGTESRIEPKNYTDVLFFRLGHFMYKMIN